MHSRRTCLILIRSMDRTEVCVAFPRPSTQTSRQGTERAPDHCHWHNKNIYTGGRKRGQFPVSNAISAATLPQHIPLGRSVNTLVMRSAGRREFGVILGTVHKSVTDYSSNIHYKSSLPLNRMLCILHITQLTINRLSVIAVQLISKLPAV